LEPQSSSNKGGDTEGGGIHHHCLHRCPSHKTHTSRVVLILITIENAMRSCPHVHEGEGTLIYIYIYIIIIIIIIIIIVHIFRFLISDF